MIDIHPLYSSSSGNMFHFESEKANILIDIGVSYKTANEGLKSIDKSMADINAILITHEHSDHIKGLPLLARKNEIPIYACGKTADLIEEELNERNIQNHVIKIDYGQAIKIKDIEVSPFMTSHDAVMPCGYILKSGTSKVTFVTDLGFVSDEVYEALNYSDFNIIESNYDNTLLDFGKYPYPLKRRIKGNLGHLSNQDTAYTISKLAKNGHTNFLLAHLSQNNNTQEIAQNTILDTLNTLDIDSSLINLNVATKDLSSEVYSC